jgi:hypothetical protein
MTYDAAAFWSSVHSHVFQLIVLAGDGTENILDRDMSPTDRGSRPSNRPQSTEMITSSQDHR